MTMIIQVEVPQVGESITEGVLVEWLKRDGDRVVTDDPLFTLETDKVTMTINAEHAGTLKILVPAGQTVKIGQVVAEVDTQPTEASPQAVPQTPGPAFHPIAGAPQARNKLAQTDLAELAPSVRRLVQEHELDPKAIEATGRDGRITKGDVLAHVAREPVPMQQPPQPTPPEVVTTPVQDAPPPVKRLAVLRTTEDIQSRQTRTPMSPLRQRIAERLVQAKNDTALLTTFNEADMSHVIALRARYKEAFEKKHGVALGFMSFFVKAVVDALQNVPELNAQIQGDEIVLKGYYDIGIAVGSPRGLVVPILRNADQMSFADIEKKIAEYGTKARDGKLGIEEMTGGTFSISNGGVFGSMLSTPIINPPQSAILGVHATKDRAVVENGQIVIRPINYLAMSYDHRIIDGREAVLGLVAMKEALEDPARLLFDI